MPSPLNAPAPNTPYFIPANNLPPGSALRVSNETPTLFRPLTIRNTTFHNRIWVAPMCQYSTSPAPPTWGSLTPYHLVTLGHYALKGAGLVFVEATAVTPNGRISPNDSGLWEDEQIEGLKPVCDFIHSQGGKVGIQLAHAGRKASTVAPWLGRERGKNIIAGTDVGGWPNDVVGPSAIAWSEVGYCKPREMTTEEIEEVVEAFAAAAKRAIKAGVDVIEIHGAHGKLWSNLLCCKISLAGVALSKDSYIPLRCPISSTRELA
jgi:2,4-dienoyl-CoA reductase-like NADH-dependent reductase (Old Yellow Enzyme family)